MYCYGKHFITIIPIASLSIRFPSGLLPNHKEAVSCSFTFPPHYYGGNAPTPRNPLVIVVLCYSQFSASCYFRNTYCIPPPHVNANVSLEDRCAGLLCCCSVVDTFFAFINDNALKKFPWFIRYCSFILLNKLLSHVNYITELVNNTTT